jgi:hypothetical protein
MQEALVCKDSAYWSDDYVYQPYAPPSHTWQVPSECGPKWKDKIAQAFNADPQPEERSHQQLLNETIDKIYDELSELISLRSDPTRRDENLEEEIDKISQELRKLQAQEADLVREYTRKKLTPIVAGLEIIKRADEIRARYGIVTTKNAAARSTDRSKT